MATTPLTAKYPAKDHVVRTFKTLTYSLHPSQRDKPQVIVLAGSETPYRNDTDRELPFRQESNFFYLSGCAVPGTFFLATYHPDSATVSTKLYVPKATLEDLMWSPAPPSPSEARAAYEVDDVFYKVEFVDHLKSLPADALVHVLPRTGEFPDVRSYVDKSSPGHPLGNSGSAVTEEHLLPALHQTRLIKDAFEIALIRKANEISSRAHEVVMRVLGLAVQGKIKQDNGHGNKRPLLPAEWLIETEAEAEAVFVASCRREGAFHQAYLPIVAANDRAATLHYCCNDKAFAWGPVTNRHANNGRHLTSMASRRECGSVLAPQVLLIDAGCEWECHSSDITRTMPVGNGGKFTTEARAIYDLVLEMQQESLAMLCPGVHWDDVQLRCHEVLVDGFLRLGIFRSAETSHADLKSHGDLRHDILTSGLSAAFFPHGVGHSLGLDVHDVPSASKPPKTGKYFVPGSIASGSSGAGGHESFYKFLRLRLPLLAGMVVTVEPGIYFSPHLLGPHMDSCFLDKTVLARYESVGGIRIEDDVLITENGSENLTMVGSETAWIEEVCAGEA
ncbi:Creatinase/aminopeptidase [Pisolithus tinctorius]|nr:Creatinase/aminopeptidase [Pisolithus tinctorius]